MGRWEFHVHYKIHGCDVIDDQPDWSHDEISEEFEEWLQSDVELDMDGIYRLLAIRHCNRNPSYVEEILPGSVTVTEAGRIDD